MSATIKLQAAPKSVQARWLPSLYEMSPHEQAYAKGYFEGWKQAEADFNKAFEERIRVSRANWDSLMRSINGLSHELILKMKDQLVSLAFQTVQKILAATPITREEIAAQIQQSLDHAETGSEVTVQINPQDLELLTAEDKAAMWNDELTHLKWVADASIPRGGCVLHGEFGWIDGRRDTRLKKLEQRATTPPAEASA